MPDVTVSVDSGDLRKVDIWCAALDGAITPKEFMSRILEIYLNEFPAPRPFILTEEQINTAVRRRDSTLLKFLARGAAASSQPSVS
jgi:hypothetical protein